MRKKKCYEVEMCDDQLRFFFLLSVYFLVVQKVEFSHPVQYSTSPKYPCFPELLYSTYIVCMVVGKNVVLAPARLSREEECLVRAKNFSARNPQLFSFSSVLTEVPKNRSHPRLIQEYFSCRSSSSSDDARQSYWIVLLWTVSSSSHRAKVLAAISIT